VSLEHWLRSRNPNLFLQAFHMFDLSDARDFGGRPSRSRRPRPRGSLRVRFNRHIILPDDPDACWGWSAALFESGYPAIAAEPPARIMLAGHRVSYQLHIGAIPEGLCVLHRCDVRSCTNPRHLFLGTKLDNALDMVAKQRQRRGEDHPRAKLSHRQATEIRVLHSFSRVAMRDIATWLGISRSLVSLILRDRIWT
jgi:hypothetical protein